MICERQESRDRPLQLVVLHMDASRIAKEASALLPLAHRVLKRYPFLVRDVEHLATHSNVMYRVITESGEQLVLRIGTPHANIRTNIEFEVAWLDAVNRDDSLDVVAPVSTASGALIVDQMDSGLGKERPRVVFTWVPGAPLGEGAGSFGYRFLGQTSASLQEHGRTWVPEKPWQMRRWNQVFYYDRDSDPVIFDDPVYGHHFDNSRQKMTAKAMEISEKMIQQSWANETSQPVHGDLHEWNVHLVGSRLHAFDFEDVMIALPAKDVVICLYQTRNDGNRAEIRSAFRKGFESVAEWPISDERQLDDFHAARQVMLMHYAARTLPMGEAASYLDRVFPWIETYVQRCG